MDALQQPTDDLGDHRRILLHVLDMHRRAQHCGAAEMGLAQRLGKKSVVGWIGAVRPSRRPLSRPPQDEELSQCHQSLILILRSA